MASKVGTITEQRARSQLARVVEPASVVAFGLLLLFGAVRVARASLFESAQLVGSGIFLAALALAWLLADLVSGIVHFLADNFGTEQTPIAGPLFIQPFREHHASPRSILDHGFLERNANNALVAVPVLLWVPFCQPNTGPEVFFAALSLFLCAWVVLTNQIHAWAHADAAPTVVRWLQGAGIFLSTAHHDQHHAHFEGRAAQATPPSHYCITSGVCDRLLARIK